MALFDIHEKMEGQYTGAASFTAKEADAVHLFCKSPLKLQQLPILLDANSEVHFVSNGDWSMHDLLKVLVPWTGPCQLWMSTYSITEFSMRQIINLQQENLLTTVNILLDYKAKVRYPAVFQLAQNTANKIATTQVHAKVTVLMNDTKSVVAVTSCNWTENKRIEVGVISRHQPTAEFHVAWLQTAINNGNIFEPD